MLTATAARAKAQNDLVIFNEIRDIEESILTAAASGLYEITVTGTTMTSIAAIGTSDRTTAIAYYNVWQGNLEDRAKFLQMGQIISYFIDLGYSIERRTNAMTSDTFEWLVSW
jgi:hypothetical protein